MQIRIWLRLIAGSLLPIIGLGFVVMGRCGVWDRLMGLDRVEEVYERFSTSYKDVDRQVGPDEDAWRSLLKLIYRYSAADIPKGREPLMLARFRAISSGKIETDSEILAEWTAPTTPIVLLYKNWPGQKIPPGDYLIIGTIDDLSKWVRQRREDLRFAVQDVLLTLFSIALALFFWFSEDSKAAKTPQRIEVTERKTDGAQGF